MFILSAQILESQGIPYRAASKILFQERLFVKRQTFSQRVKQEALNLYEEYVNSGIYCLLIESAEQITFWRELSPDYSYATAMSKSRPALPQHQSRSAQSLIPSSSPAAKLPKHQLDDAIRVKMPERKSTWSLQEPASQKPAPQKSLTRIQQVRPSNTAVYSGANSVVYSATNPLTNSPINPLTNSPINSPIDSPETIAPAPAAKISTLPPHLRRLTYR